MWEYSRISVVLKAGVGGEDSCLEPGWSVSPDIFSNTEWATSVCAQHCDWQEKISARSRVKAIGNMTHRQKRTLCSPSTSMGISYQLIFRSMRGILRVSKARTFFVNISQWYWSSLNRRSEDVRRYVLRLQITAWQTGRDGIETGEQERIRDKLTLQTAKWTTVWRPSFKTQWHKK